MNCNNCHRCLDGIRDDYGFPVALTRMILCSNCGNKRCPRATDHEFKCTDSNEPDQPGSMYSNINFRALEE